MGLGKKIRDAYKKHDFNRGKRKCLRKKAKHGDSSIGGCSIEAQIHYGIRPESDRPKTKEQKLESFKKILKGARRDKPTAKQTKGVKSGTTTETKGVKRGNTTETKGIKNGN